MYEDKAVMDESLKKEVEVDNWGCSNGSSALLGYHVWDKPTNYDGDFKLEYMDLDEFLSEHGIPVDFSQSQQQQQQQQQHQQQEQLDEEEEEGELCWSPTADSELQEEEKDDSRSGESSQSTDSSRASPEAVPRTDQNLSLPPTCVLSNQVTENMEEIYFDVNFSPDELALATVPGDSFDPRTRSFSKEELKLQPVIKKSKKKFVNEGAKDERYWARRKKNNMAAKRSRDARRRKENQITLRAAFLEKENSVLWAELEKTQKENKELKERLAKYEPGL